MQIQFYKYQGTGNDFVMIDNRTNTFPKKNTQLIEFLCDRRVGIGGDGLILLENHEKYDFTRVAYNSDGSTSTMCGNGGRCLVAFAKQLGIIKYEAHFEASDGYHFAKFENNLIALQMIDVTEVKHFTTHDYVYTGSPHHVQLVEDLKHFDVKNNGAKLRYSDLYDASGCNINFIAQENTDTFSVRTYERGVEDETLSCGTGATAVAIAMNATKKTTANRIHINVLGGKLTISFDVENNIYKNVFLTGPAEMVFAGSLDV
jgi:diaminopimelate epimerase